MMNKLATVVIATTLLAAIAVPVWAADSSTTSTTSSSSPSPVAMPAAGMSDDWRDRDRMQVFSDEKERLEEILETAQSRGDYRLLIETAGYMITAVNEDSPAELEFEIVKGNESYEVQLEFTTIGPADDVDVTTNIWRADSTKRAMSDPGYSPGVAVYDPAIGNRFRDRRRMPATHADLHQLRQTLMPGLEMSDYMATVAKQGYEVTAINEHAAGSAEFEIVKGRQSYEVQLDLDPRTGLATEVEVDTNVWQSKETEKALGD